MPEETRKLVTLRSIDDITPIEDADKIECAHIGGWTVVVKKGEFYKGQKVFYFEIDSMLPLDHSYFKFLGERSKMVKDGKLYHRLKTAKLRGQISQGLIMPYTIADANWRAGWEDDMPVVAEGESPYYDPDVVADKMIDIMENHDGDFSEYFGVIKYEAPIPGELRGKVRMWEDWITHTDEERVQNLDKITQDAILAEKNQFIATEKIDGTSCTIWAKVEDDGNMRYGVCSRNWGLEEDDDNTYWKLAKTQLIGEDDLYISPLEYVKTQAYNQATLRNEPASCVLQGEIFGENIQNNPLGQKGQHIRFFNLFINGRQVMYDELKEKFPELLPCWVPLHDLTLPDTIDEMVKQPDGITTKVPNSKEAQIEGIVWRHRTKPFLEGTKTIDLSKVPEEKRELVKASKKFQDVKASFKCISNKYLLKHE